MMKKINIITLGCSKNIYDSELILGGLKKNDFIIVDEPVDADYVIVNTCGFLDSAREESIDYILSLILKKKTNLSVINIFRLVISELALKEAPNYALVNSAVDLAKVNLKTKYFLGLINAVSRRLVDKYQEKEFSLKSTLEKDFKNYLRKNYSNEIADNIEKTYTLNNTVDISIKNSNEIEIWKKKLKAVLLPTGSLRIKKNGKLSDIVGFKEGKWWVQNISSSIPVKLLGDLKGKEVLDLFSAPGGKAMQLIALGANVTCVDKSLQRIKKFEQNLIRMKMSTEIIQTDVYKFKSKKVCKEIKFFF